MCGAPNAADNTVCDRCEAALMPIGGEDDAPLEPDSGRPPTTADQDAPAAPEETTESTSSLSRLFPGAKPGRGMPALPDEMHGQSRTMTGETDQPAESSPSPSEGSAESGASDDFTPGWLQEAMGKTDFSDSAETSAELPDWLQETNAPTSDASSPEPRAPFGGDSAPELPSWLRGDEEGGTESPQPPDQEQEELTLEPAALPSWLKSLQPEVVAFSDEIDLARKEAEASSGLLAGIPGPLPVEPIVAMPHIVAPIRQAEISEDVRAGQLLRKLQSRRAAAEAEVKQEAFRFPWQVIGYLVLLVALLVPLLLNTKLFNVERSPEPSKAFFKAVETMPQGSAVLMVFDYEADLMGEMEPEAKAILRHLSERNLRVVSISTVPQGPYLAQQAWNQVAKDDAQTQYGQQFINLGFLVGREIGLRSLVQGKFGLDRPDFTNGRLLHTYAAMKDLRNIHDVGAIIIVGSTPETIRIWLEQVGTKSQQVPILVAVPASVEPAVLPYYHAKQVKGIVVGLVGAADYELQTGHAPSSGAAIDSLSVGALAALFLMAVGALAAIGSNRRKRK